MARRRPPPTVERPSYADLWHSFLAVSEAYHLAEQGLALMLEETYKRPGIIDGKAWHARHQLLLAARDLVREWRDGT